ncbi:hypothetical protein I3843_12G051300 [Carya illinoinensis]|nr:hypothetical protein I3843_12G051300 [Carya illinoinensis]
MPTTPRGKASSGSYMPGRAPASAACRSSRLTSIVLVTSGSHRRKEEFDDIFDTQFESAVVLYQQNLGLPVTGKLDTDTILAIISPRCGMSDHNSHNLHTTRHFAFFNGQPRWLRPPPMTLTYSFYPSNMIDYLSSSDIRTAFRRAFSRWESVIPVNFTETMDYQSANIRIGFFGGESLRRRAVRWGAGSVGSCFLTGERESPPGCSGEVGRGLQIGEVKGGRRFGIGGYPRDRARTGSCS